MRKTIDTSPHIGARYGSQDKTFIITGLPELNNDQWVEYTDSNNKKDYYCRLEAFLARFHPLID